MSTNAAVRISLDALVVKWWNSIEFVFVKEICISAKNMGPHGTAVLRQILRSEQDPTREQYQSTTITFKTNV